MDDAPKIEVHQDFAQVYDLRDPRPYYRHLMPVEYRMPAVVAEFLRLAHGALVQGSSTTRPRLLDFACGFGAVPALLRHDLTLAELYGHYESDEADFLSADETFFAARRLRQQLYDIAGLDIASNAIAYARACGLLDGGFDQDLLAGPPDEELQAFLSETALIYECGAMLDILQPALLSLIDSASGTKKPWLLYAPRFDVDDTYLQERLPQRGYVVEIVNRQPIRYRRSLGPKERAQHEEVIRGHGRDPAQGFDGDYLVLDLKLARPVADAEAIPVSGLMISG